MKDYIHCNIRNSHWIDGTNHRVTLKLPCLDKIIDYAKKHMDRKKGVLSIFRSIKRLHHTYKKWFETIDEEELIIRRHEMNFVPSLQSSLFKRRNLPPTNIQFKDYKKYRRMYVDTDCCSNLPPIPLFDPIKPLVCNKFIVHVLIIMGCFDTELEL